MGCPTAAWDQTREVAIIPPRPRDASWDARPRRGIKRGRLGSSRPESRGTRRGCPSAERDETHRGWDQSARMAGRPVGRHEVRTDRCVCGDLLEFCVGVGLWHLTSFVYTWLGLAHFCVLRCWFGSRRRAIDVPPSSGAGPPSPSGKRGPVGPIACCGPANGSRHRRGARRHTGRVAGRWAGGREGAVLGRLVLLGRSLTLPGVRIATGRSILDGASAS
jgi:hypothetical protein